MKFTALLSSSLVSICLLFISGCAGYTPVNDTELGYSSIYIDNVRNETFLPQIETTLKSRIIAEIENSTDLEATSQANADVVLHTIIKSLEREEAAIQIEDTGRVRKIRMKLLVDCTLVSSSTGKSIFANKMLTISVDVFTDQGQNAAEYQAQPEIAKKVAVKIGELLVDVW